MEMTGFSSAPKAVLLTAGLALAACATVADNPDDVPDFVVQHTLSALTSAETFSWEASPGRSFTLRPLGTFKSGEVYCRDYEVSLSGVAALPARRTACRINESWVRVDPTTLPR
jgi:hypothetical protein